MRIDDILRGQAIPESKKTEAVGSAAANDAFSQMLQSEIVGQGSNTAAEDVVCGPEVLPGFLGIALPVSNLAKDPEATQAVAALDNVLTQLDSLQNALQETKSPKEINTLVEQINTQAANLDDQMSGLSDDHQLRGMAEEVKIAAYMESVKWRRGDYL